MPFVVKLENCEGHSEGRDMRKMFALCTATVLLLLILLTVGCQSAAVQHNDRGVALTTEGGYDEAIAEFSKAIELEPEYVVAYSNRGYAYGLKGEWDIAIADFDKAIELAPDYVLAYNNRGYAYE